MIFGKLIAGPLGLLVAGLPGLILGLLAGHFFDRGLQKSLSFTSPQRAGQIQESFFETIFLLLGYLAKSDGRVSEQEIAQTEQIFAQMGLSPEQRRRAIELFQSGSSNTFNLQTTVGNFTEACGPQKQLQHNLMVFLISMALADGLLESAERSALNQIAVLMGYGTRKLDLLLKMINAQQQYSNQQSQKSSVNQLQQAHDVLGVDASMDDKTVKRAYRKLMSENHPDKLIAQGVPEHMLKMATEKSQNIQSAYEQIKQSRK
jgi:DnaJ like chaperone protein